MTIDLDGEKFNLDVPEWQCSPADYELFFDSPEPHLRSGVYSTGPPDINCSPEVLRLAARLPQPVLDYGCGTGALVRELRSLGVEAFGLDLDTSEMRAATDRAASPFVSYVKPGQRPILPHGPFESVVCSEVLEHVPDLGFVVAHIRQMANQSILITVPDASGIPTLHQHAVVPWHMLEGSHVNFFSRAALRRLFEPEFSVANEYGLGNYTINSTPYYTSIGTLFERSAARHRPSRQLLADRVASFKRGKRQ